MKIPESISRRRTELMGLSALLIIINHLRTATHFELWNRFAANSGGLGVDFFVFLSGFGCVFSLKKNREIGPYYMRRMKRLAPPYYAAVLLSILVSGSLPPIRVLLGNLVPIGLWTGVEKVFWYAQACPVLYILVPMLLYLMENARFPRIMFLGLMALFALVIPRMVPSGCCQPFINCLPGLVVGVAMGVYHHARREKRDEWILTGILLLVGAASCLPALCPAFFQNSPLHRLAGLFPGRVRQILCVPLILALLAVMLEWIERTPLRFLDAFLRAAGRYSLELYFGNTIVRYAATRFLGLRGWKLLLVMLTVSWPAALLIKWGGKGLSFLAGKLMRPAPDGEK